MHDMILFVTLPELPPKETTYYPQDVTINSSCDLHQERMKNLVV